MSPTAERLFEPYASQQGWSESTCLDLLADWLTRSDWDRFRHWLAMTADAENEFNEPPKG